MPHVVFVAPHLLENTNRYVRAFAALPDVTLSLVSEDPAEAIPHDVRGRVAGHYRVARSLEGADLTAATRAISRSVGRVDRITGALEQLQNPLAEVRDALGIEGMNGETARSFRDKDRMKEVLRAHGVPVARSGLAGSPEALARFCEQVGYPIIVKPREGVGARATYRVSSPEELAALARGGVVPTKHEPLQVEEFVRAREHTCETVTVRGEPVFHSGTRYLPSPLEVLENPWIKYCVLLPRETDLPEVTAFHPINVAALTALFGDARTTAAGTALTHMEWFLKDDGTALVNEVGARPPGVQIMPLMSLAYDTNFIADWAELVALDRFTPKPRVAAAGAAFLRGQGAGDRVVEVHGVEEAAAEVGDALVQLRPPKVGQARASGYEGEGIALVRHATTEGVKKALGTLIQRIQIRYG